MSDWLPEMTPKNIALTFITSFLGGLVGSFLMSVHMYGWHEVMRRLSGLL
jgi:hypothetical protein